MAIVQRAITAARTIRSEREVHPGAKVSLALRHDEESVRALLTQESLAIETLVKTESLIIEPGGGARPKGAAMSVAEGVEVLVTLRGVVDADKERERVAREIKKSQKSIDALEKRLGSKGFAERAPADVVQEARDSLAAEQDRLRLLGEAQQLAAEL